MNQQLIEALNTWPHWQVEQPGPPIYLYELTSGLTNKSHLVCVEERYYVIRLNAQDPCALAINRLHEHIIVEKLSSYKLCPKIVYPEAHIVECDQRFTVFEYVDGRTWDNHDFVDRSNQQRLLQAIETYQQLVVNIPVFDYLRCVHNYWEAIIQRDIVLNADVVAAYTVFCQRLDLFLKNSYTPVLSHHDLVPDNIIETQQGLMILDWEYASMGHPDFDRMYIQKYISGSLDMQTSAVDILKINVKSPIEQLVNWLNYLWLMLR